MAVRAPCTPFELADARVSGPLVPDRRSAWTPEISVVTPNGNFPVLAKALVIALLQVFLDDYIVSP